MILQGWTLFRLASALQIFSHKLRAINQHLTPPSFFLLGINFFFFRSLCFLLTLLPNTPKSLQRVLFGPGKVWP
jgi:hypothetical protein